MSDTLHCPSFEIHRDGQGWLGRVPTGDEQEILQFLLKRRRIPEAILHIGVGNSLFFQALGTSVRQGLTIDEKEAVFSRGLGLPTLLCNKYAVSSWKHNTIGPFDCIIDVNIRSYSCCDTHFFEYISALADNLSPRGVIITSRRGLSYLKPTTVLQLRQMFEDWSIAEHNNVVIMKPGNSLRDRFELFWKW